MNFSVEFCSSARFISCAELGGDVFAEVELGEGCECSAEEERLLRLRMLRKWRQRTMSNWLRSLRVLLFLRS
ncbi:hypothetical protein RchiOBHm_Chr6g0298981 [Rosa chinensis]|uniref:Uncharacterized protein n=1 Tax=Rosa chinensis TaxID=74649 RepID=A0A2P6PY38_ROSCH|nr:hypothetical protein RchiOBHm_Chr6g0298981 [Rosa chinensis]